MKILIIGLQYPEPFSTAAGKRMLQIIELLNSYNFDLHFAYTSPKNQFTVNLSDFSITEHLIKINDSSVDMWLKKLQPQVVVFDRYITEEQFGWRVDEYCTKALKVLDTEDLHFLRDDRENRLKKIQNNNNSKLLSDKSKRELAAILRCDWSLMISRFEIELLVQTYGIPKTMLFYLPFVYNIDKLSAQTFTGYKERKHFMSIGNFKHKPNLDMVEYLNNDIWPRIREKLPESEWHIYGAYVPEKIKQLHFPKRGVIVKGRATEVLSTLKNYKLMLAPLRFGAGLKGKCLESMLAGTPSVTTTIGAEGIAEEKEWPGFVENHPVEFAKQSIVLYKDKSLWENRQEQGFKIINGKFNIEDYRDDFRMKIMNSFKNLMILRQKNIIGQVLKHHHQRSTKFMSLWIEEKNKTN